MTVAEFKRWIAFDRISPIGDERIDLITLGKRVEWYTPPMTPELQRAILENERHKQAAEKRLGIKPKTK